MPTLRYSELIQEVHGKIPIFPEQYIHNIIYDILLKKKKINNESDLKDINFDDEVINSFVKKIKQFPNPPSNPPSNTPFNPPSNPPSNPDIIVVEPNTKKIKKDKICGKIVISSTGGKICQIRTIDGLCGYHNK